MSGNDLNTTLLQPGALVRLKSGGPVMTLEKFGKFGGQMRASVVWFEGVENRRALFAPEVLTLIDQADEAELPAESHPAA